MAMGRWLLVLATSQLVVGCGRIGFDSVSTETSLDAAPSADAAAPDASTPCVAGAACELAGLCFTGTSVCDPVQDCSITDAVAAATECTAGSCEADGVCLGTLGTTIVADSTSPTGVGYSVAIDGDRMVAGAWNPYNQSIGGAAVVFERGNQGWSEVARIVPSDSSANDGFGASVAVQGDTIMIGARRWFGTAYQGGVYVYEKIDGTWTEFDFVTVPGVINLGSALAIDGDRAIATAQLGMINGGWGSGHVLERGLDKKWSVVATLTSPNADSLGWSADIDGDRIVLGSLWTSTPNDTGSGAIHVFERAGATDWPEVATLYPPTPAMGGGFWSAGSSVAVDGNTIASGDQMATVGNIDSGAIMVWNRTDQGWMPEQLIVENDSIDGSNFGRSVAIANGRLAATSTDYTNCEIRVSIFQQHAGSWTQVGRIAPAGIGCSDGQAVEGHISDLSVTMDQGSLFFGYPVSDGLSGGGSVVEVSLQGF